MNFYDYEDVIQRLTLFYSKENLMEALKIISYFNDYDELRKKLVMAINLYDKEEIAEHRKYLFDYARLLTVNYDKETLKKYLSSNKNTATDDGRIEKDAIEIAVEIYDDEDTCKEREELRNGGKE